MIIRIFYLLIETSRVNTRTIFKRVHIVLVSQMLDHYSGREILYENIEQILPNKLHELTLQNM